MMGAFRLLFVLLYIWAILFMSMTPAISAHRIQSQIYLMKVTLYERLMYEEDERNKDKLDMFIKYIEARPMMFYFCNTIAIDSSLLMQFIKYYIKYLIFVLQLTRLYDSEAI